MSGMSSVLENHRLPNPPFFPPPPKCPSTSSFQVHNLCPKAPSTPFPTFVRRPGDGDRQIARMEGSESSSGVLGDGNGTDEIQVVCRRERVIDVFQSLN